MQSLQANAGGQHKVSYSTEALWLIFFRTVPAENTDIYKNRFKDNLQNLQQIKLIQYCDSLKKPKQGVNNECSF